MSVKRNISLYLEKIRATYKILLFELARHKKVFLLAIPVVPKVASINITDNCNSRCITCNMWKNKSTNELSLEEIQDILTQMKDIKISGVGFEGGEPLLRQDLPQMVERAHQLGFKDIGITTNGLLLTREKAEDLLQKGLNSILISMEGIGDTHDFIRGIQGAYQKTMGALEELVDLRNTKYPEINISIGTLLMRPTMDEIIPLAELSHRLKVGFSIQLVDVSPVFFTGIDATSLWIDDQSKLDALIGKLYELRKVNSALKHYSHARLEYARNYFQDPKRADIPCFLGYLLMYIDAHGGVYPGCWPLGSVGNLREKRLKDIINSREYREHVRAMFRKECPGCSCNFPPNLGYYMPTLIGENLRKLNLRQ